VSVKIRLTRTGRKKQPYYRIVVMDSRVRRDGAYVDQIGIYQPKRQPAVVNIEDEKALLWLSRGAIPSDTVRTLLSQRGLMLRHDLTKRNYPPEKVEAAVTKWKEEADARQAERNARRGGKRKAKPAEETAPTT
jgi:small subunit ribosomal protein S16